MHANSSESRTYAHTQPAQQPTKPRNNPIWEGFKWMVAGGAVLSICNTLYSLATGGVV